MNVPALSIYVSAFASSNSDPFATNDPFGFPSFGDHTTSDGGARRQSESGSLLDF